MRRKNQIYNTTACATVFCYLFFSARLLFFGVVSLLLLSRLRVMLLNNDIELR